jgi:trk system potassium uptake protein TrkH
MRFPVIIRFIGIIIIINALFLTASGLISYFRSETSTIPLLFTAFLTTALGVFPVILAPKRDDITLFEGMVIVVGGWIVTGLIGALPYFMWGGEFTFVNAWFESVSGYTTTGASILNNIEALPNGLLFWRASTHFIGGVGVILFALVILPLAAGSKMVLFNFEISNMAKDNLRYRTKYAMQVILFVYIFLGLSETLLLWAGGMPVFDSICHSLATISTGGFSTKNASVAFYDSFYIELVIIVFMFLSGLHFGLLFETFRFKKDNIFNSPVVKYYFYSVLIAFVFMSVKLVLSSGISWGDALRMSAFQSVSIGTSTGFGTTDTNIWPGFNQFILIFLSLQCACAGSTTSGIKCDRMLVMFKGIRQQIKYLQHPNAISVIKIKNTVISQDIVSRIGIFVFIFLLILVVSTLLLSMFNLDLMTSFSASLATLSNVGPGFGMVGSVSNYSDLPDSVKMILSINMLLGRLEIFGFISLFFIRSWK